VGTTALCQTSREEDGIFAFPVHDPRNLRLAIHCFNTEDEFGEGIERRV
jgi:hypothetical protein